MKMKLYFLTILMIVAITLVTQNAIAIPYMSPQDLYKESKMVIYGLVISKQAGPKPDYDYYNIKVQTYFKDQQSPDFITVPGYKDIPANGTYPQFNVGDKAIFYL